MSLALRERSTRFSIDGATIPIPAGDCVGAGDLATLRCHIGLSRRDVELSVAETRPGPPKSQRQKISAFAALLLLPRQYQPILSCSLGVAAQFIIKRLPRLDAHGPRITYNAHIVPVDRADLELQQFEGGSCSRIYLPSTRRFPC